MMKKFIAATLYLTMLLCVCANAALPSPTHEFYAADYADVLSQDTERFIIDYSNALYQSTTAQVVVATVPDMDGQEVREYGLALGRAWGIGSKENNGVLILLALEERKVSIEVGYGLEGALNDSKTGRLIDDYAMADLKKGDYDAGLLNLYQAVLQEVYNEYGLTMPDGVAPVQTDESEDSRVGIISIVMTILVFLLIVSIGRGTGRRGGHGNGGYRRYRPVFGAVFTRTRYRRTRRRWFWRRLRRRRRLLWRGRQFWRRRQLARILM